MQVSNSLNTFDSKSIQDQSSTSEKNLQKHCNQWMKFPDCSTYCLKQKVSPSNMQDCKEACFDARAFCEVVSRRKK